MKRKKIHFGGIFSRGNFSWQESSTLQQNKYEKSLQVLENHISQEILRYNDIDKKTNILLLLYKDKKMKYLLAALLYKLYIVLQRGKKGVNTIGSSKEDKVFFTLHF